MKRCEYCGIESSDDTVRCKGCGTVFADALVECETAAKGNEPLRRRKAFRILSLLCAVLVLGLFAAFFFFRPAGPGVALSFSGHATNSAGVRVAVFDLVNSNQQQILYRAMSDPEWPRPSGSGRLPPFSPSRFVQYGRLPAFSHMKFEVPEPTGVAAGSHYHLSFAYCRDPGRLGEPVHRFWRRWVLRWVPVKQEAFPPPGFGTRTAISREVDL